MDLKRLRQRCEARLRELDLPAPFDVPAFCEVLGLRHGRRIQLWPVVATGGPCGFWVAGKTVDYIFYERATSPLHQEHIILHEISHLLCNHRSAPVAEEELLRLLFPHLEAETVKLALQRTTYAADEEQEAELLASLMLERVGRRVRPRAPKTDPQVAALLGRLEAALEPPARG